MKRLRTENINTPEYFDNQFEDKPIDMENNLRQEKYLEMIGNKRGRVIELGCGVSYFPQMATKLGESWGLDFTPKAMEKMRKELPEVNYVCGDALCTPFRDGFFDIVVSGELLEHLERPQELVDEMARIAKKDGVLVLSTPHLEFDDPEHIWEFSLADLKEMFSKYGQTRTDVIQSDRFPGREYLFIVCQKH